MPDNQEKSFNSIEDIAAHFKELKASCIEMSLLDRAAKMEVPGCVVLSVKDTETALIVGHKKPAFLLEKDQPVQVFYKHLAREWEFNSKILSYAKLNEYEAWKIPFPEVLDGHPARGCPRVRPSAAKPIMVNVKLPEPYNKTLNLRIVDISSSGLGFATGSGKYFKIGGPVSSMEFVIPGYEATIKAVGEVRLITECKVGLKFINLAENDKKLIGKYVEARKIDVSDGGDRGPGAYEILNKKKKTATYIANILFVEDQPMPQVIIGDLLKKNKYNVTLAVDGVDGVKKAIESPPDLILMDMNMPKMNGDEACKKMKQDPNTKDIPVIMLTSSQDRDTVVRSIQAGADDYIIKSGEHAQLLKKVKRILIKKGVIKE